MNLRTFKNFFRSEATGGIVLIFCVCVSLIVANSRLGDDFENLLSMQIGIASAGLRYPVLLWINDGLMAVFFLLIGLEIKRELVEGELSSLKKAALPVFAACGGAIIPAVIFFALNYNEPGEAGWGIPMATDIAFALGVLALLGKRVPPSLKIFLAALAIVDDLIAILVIAIFYSAELHLTYLLYAGGIFILLILFNRFQVKNILFYIVPGLFIWYLIHHSGVHATIAGVLTAFTLPTTPGREESSLEKLEHILHNPVNYFIMPVFALANTNIDFSTTSGGLLTDSLGIGIMAGLILGKPVGITLLSWITVKLKWSVLPARVRWRHVMGLGMLGGIGFTMSIFIALLSFSNADYQHASKVAILIASTASGILGYVLLNAVKEKRKIKVSSPESG